MRRTIVLLVLLSVMLGLHALKTEPVGTQDPLTLAAIGFVLLAAFTVAEIGSVLSLPRVTGYIVAGAVLGPHVANILSRTVVQEMRMFNTLALGLIAISAGLELSVSQLAKIFRTLAGTIAAKVLLGIALVGGTFYFVQGAFAVLDLTSRGQQLALAAVLGALSIGTSPAIALAVMSETKARGRLTDLVLGAAILKDLVVVVVLAIAVALARGLVTPDARHAGALTHVAIELGGSILMGGVLGLVLIAYIRYVKAEMLLFVAAMILVVAEAARAFHLELLLVFISGGFVVRNFSKYEHDLMTPVQMVALPVFVVFFTIAGAGVDLPTTWRILPLALALCVARAIAYYFAASIGNSIGRESVEVRRGAWLAYLPQAGVTLGLVGLACEQLPELRQPLFSTGMAVVAINLLIGPITLRAALRNAGEIPGAEEGAAAAGESEDGRDSLVESRSLAQRIEAALQQISHAHSRRAAHHLTRDLISATETWAAQHVQDWGRRRARDLQRLIDQMAMSRDTSPLMQWLAAHPPESSEEHATLCRQLFVALRERIRRAPELLVVPLEDHHRRPVAGDGLAIRVKKRLSALGRALTFRRSPKRQVPLQQLARIAYESRGAAMSASFFASRLRLEATILEELRLYVEGALSAEEVRERVKLAVDEWIDVQSSDAIMGFVRGLEALLGPLNRADTAYLARSKIRSSDVEPQIREAVRMLDSAGEWTAALRAAHVRLGLSLEIMRFALGVQEALRRDITQPIQHTEAGVRDIVHLVRGRLSQAYAQVDANETVSPAEAKALVDEVGRVFGDAELEQLEQAAAQFRAAASVHSFARELRAEVAELTEAASIPDPKTPVFALERASDLKLLPAAPRTLASNLLVRGYLPTIDVRLDAAVQTISRAPRRIRDALLQALEPIRDRLNDVPETALKGLLLESFRGGLSGLDELDRSLAEHVEGARQFVDERLQAELIALREGLLHATTSARAAVAQGYVRQGLHSVRRWLRRVWQAIMETSLNTAAIARRLVGSELTQEVWLKYAKAEVDAADIADHLQRHRMESVPNDYAQLFRIAPVREHRYFVANRAQLRELLDSEQDWLKGGPSSALVVGAAGSGRTSILNMCEMESNAPRVIRPHPIEWRRDLGLIRALSFELGCRPRPTVIARALSVGQTTVLIDDLEQWVTPDPAGIAAMGELLDLIVATRRQTFWIVTISRSALSVMEAVTPVRQAFSRVIDLPALDAAKLQKVIESRHQASGRGLVYPRTVLSSLLDRLPRYNDRDVCFGVLSRASEGNLSRALGLWLHIAGTGASGEITPELHRAVSIGLPFMGQLKPAQTATLILLARFGAMTPLEITEHLALSRGEAARHLSFLQTSGLLEQRGPDQDLLRIPPGLVPLVLSSLHETGAEA